MSRCVIVRLALSAVAACIATSAAAIDIKSNQGTGQDGFAYSNPGVTFPLSNSYHVRPAVATVGQAHDTESLVQFDLSSLTFTPAQIAAPSFSATLKLWVDDGSSTGFGNNPTGANPVQVDVYAATGTWSRGTLVWSNKPGTGSVLDTETISSIGQWISYDVTSTVQSWLTSPATNFGFLLRSNHVVGGPGNYYVAAFDSGFLVGGAADPTANAPTLSVVPEPASCLLGLLAIPFVACIYRRQRAKRVH
jgi:hypothetical protein